MLGGVHGNGVDLFARVAVAVGVHGSVVVLVGLFPLFRLAVSVTSRDGRVFMCSKTKERCVRAMMFDVLPFGAREGFLGVA